MTGAIVTAIEPQLASSERQRARRKPTENLDAWECYQRGLSHMFTYEQIEQALQYFQRAVELDPEFSSPYAGIAYSYAVRILIGTSTDREGDLQRGVAAAEAALEIDQTDPFVLFVHCRISIFNGEHEKAINSAQRAISLNPNYALAHFGLAHALWHAGRPGEALEHHDEAIRLSPHDPILWAFLASKAIALVMAERYEDGIAASREAQRNLGSQSQRSNLFAYLGEVSGLGLLDKKHEAEQALQRMRNELPNVSLEFIETSLPMLESDTTDRLFHGLTRAGMS